MAIITSKDRVPEHLVGTRAGLFHVLRGTSIVPQDDPMARAELPEVSAAEDSSIFSDVLRNSPVFLKSTRDKIAALMREDEFHFNF